LQSLLKIKLSLGSPTPEVGPCDDFDVRHEVSIPLRHDYYDDTYCNGLKVSSDPLPHLVVASSQEFSTVTDTLEDSLTIDGSSHPFAPLGELEEEDEFEIDASSDSQCGTLVE